MFYNSRSPGPASGVGPGAMSRRSDHGPNTVARKLVKGGWIIVEQSLKFFTLQAHKPCNYPQTETDGGRHSVMKLRDGIGPYKSEGKSEEKAVLPGLAIQSGIV